ncbi:MAG: hypothetical protein QOI71_3713, partial [Gaiellales bacterium]|nr:hypothetical protein [Gaiellales bacterium]
MLSVVQHEQQTLASEAINERADEPHIALAMYVQHLRDRGQDRGRFAK